ncbi:hypothetical protein KJ819_01570 [Patescibacteria group bacterium]|nr:hypothetical protein [Patescibacteria group bacterium]MBU1501027.1 hypothetical protein [Patescibacteria group bacterium]MBU2080657.1 hypothetical protein [Patescibacteria group bacterium]MBU2124268.1 hypothetical protein [Patescibacteria group bacterium]MBU2194394.1 hypothetical protein [Patescibacteria group bacterium]
MSKATRKERKLWFRAKDYGYGWYPITWQGWVITALYAIAFTSTVLIFGAWAGAAVEANADLREAVFGVLEFLIVLALLSYSLFRVCTRFGEKPEWRWGKK